MITIKYIFILIFISPCLSQEWNCSKDDAIKAFKNKQPIKEYPHFNNDPYLNQTKSSMNEILSTISNRTIVCAIKYTDSNRFNYTMKNFESKELAENENFIVTHQGKCGACSNLQDLSVYLSGDLTTPVRKCGIVGKISIYLSLKCLQGLGFTEQCSQIWQFNAHNTSKKCFWVCIISWIKNEPFTKPDGTLNDCIQCDEDESGPVFKYFSGRSRRNSGIHSEIERNKSDIYNLTHCYY